MNTEATFYEQSVFVAFMFALIVPMTIAGCTAIFWMFTA